MSCNFFTFVFLVALVSQIMVCESFKTFHVRFGARNRHQVSKVKMMNPITDWLKSTVETILPFQELLLGIKNLSISQAELLRKFEQIQSEGNKTQTAIENLSINQADLLRKFESEGDETPIGINRLENNINRLENSINRLANDIRHLKIDSDLTVRLTIRNQLSRQKSSEYTRDTLVKCVRSAVDFFGTEPYQLLSTDSKLLSHSKLIGNREKRAAQGFLVRLLFSKLLVHVCSSYF